MPQPRLPDFERMIAPQPDAPVNPQPPQMPQWRQIPPYLLNSTQGLPPIAFAIGNSESGMRNRREVNPDGSPGHADGYFQIETSQYGGSPTWEQFAPQAGVDLNRFPVPSMAPLQAQWAVARVIPMRRWTAGMRAAQGLYPWLNPNQTVGQIADSARMLPPQQYIPAEARGPGGWGRPPTMEAGPGRMPQSYDMPGLMQGMWPIIMTAARNTSLPGMAMLTAYQGMNGASSRGQLELYKLMKDRWRTSMEETIARGEEEGLDWSDIFNTCGDDEDCIGRGVTQLASKYNDPVILDAFHNGGSARVRTVLDARDKKFQDLSRAGRSEKSEEQKQADLEKTRAETTHAEAGTEQERARTKQIEQGGTGGLEPEDTPGSQIPGQREAQPSQPDQTVQPREAPAGAAPAGVPTGPAGPPAPAEAPPPPPAGQAPGQQGAAPQAPSGPQQQAQAAPETPDVGPPGPPTAQLPSDVAQQGVPITQTALPPAGPSPLPPAARGAAAPALRPAEGATPEVPGLKPFSSTPANARNMGRAQIDDSRLDQDARRYMRTGRDQYTRYAVAGEMRNELVRQRASQIQNSFDQVLADAREARDAGHPWSPQEILNKLAQFDPGISAHAREIANGDMPMLTSAWAANSQYWANMWEVVPQINPGFSGGFYTRKQNWLNNLGTGQNGVSRMAMNTVMMHLAQLRDAIKTLPQGSSPDLNAMQNWISVHSGGAAVSNFNELLGHVSQEVTRVFRGTGGNVSDIQRELGNISASSSPAQKLGYIKTMADLLMERMASIASTGEMQTDTAVDPQSLMSQQARVIYRELHDIPVSGVPRTQADPYGFTPGDIVDFGHGQLTYQGGGVWADPQTSTAYVAQPGWKPNDKKTWILGQPIEAVPFQQLPTIPPPDAQRDPQTGWEFN
jgi:hypothetical protein